MDMTWRQQTLCLSFARPTRPTGRVSARFLFFFGRADLLSQAAPDGLGSQGWAFAGFRKQQTKLSLVAALIEMVMTVENLSLQELKPHPAGQC